MWRPIASPLSSVKLTIFVFNAALIGAVTARLGLELNVAELQHGRHQLQHRLHLVLHKAHNLHGILEGDNTKQWSHRSADVVEPCEKTQTRGCKGELSYKCIVFAQS